MFIPESQGWYQAGDFQVAHYVARRQSQKVGIATFTVQVSGTSVELLETTPLVPRASFEESLDLLAECGIGDHLDQLNANLEAGGPVQEVVCQTSYVQDLMKRAPVPDAIAIDYIVSKTYWSKKRSGVAIVSGRLELRPERLHRPFRFEARAASAGPLGPRKPDYPVVSLGPSVSSAAGSRVGAVVCGDGGCYAGTCGAPACGSGVAPTGQLSGASVGQVIPSILTPQRSTLLHRGCSRGVPYPCSPRAGLSSRARKAYGLFPNQLGATGGARSGR
jgi:hypothetical protein